MGIPISQGLGASAEGIKQHKNSVFFNNSNKSTLFSMIFFWKLLGFTQISQIMLSEE